PLRIQRFGNQHHYLGNINGPELLLLLPQAKAIGSVAMSLMDEEWQPPQHLHGFTHSGSGYQRPKVIPYEADLQRAAEVLN
ncbi:DUF484 family protein, partial [Pantoea agglomerans]|uniref:DUF484 family protein n=1 Tax=Enterobacter agglomerans TaxID=549 RepID=UPI001F5CC445